MTPSPGHRAGPAVRRRAPWGAAAALLLALPGCGVAPPEPTPIPTPAPRPSAADARAVAERFVDAWSARSYVRLYGLISAADRQDHNLAEIRGLLASFDDLARVHRLSASVGAPVPVALPPQPRPPDAPVPTAGPAGPPGSPAASAAASDGPSPSPAPTAVPPRTPLDGPVPALSVPIQLHFDTGNFGAVSLERELILLEGPAGWQVRWSPTLLFPELRDAGSLDLERAAPRRGSIIGTDGTVWAETREDGTRIYPQEWLAGQTIGYVGRANADDLVSLERIGVRAGDPIGRIGLELGADALLRGRAGFTLRAIPSVGDPVPVLSRDVEDGVDVVITLRPSLQAAAQAAIAGYNEAGTAVVDPASGDLWALASVPAFNPNAMTIGTTLGGAELPPPTGLSILNHATLAAYPAGSSFKVFTLAAALQTGVAGPATRMPCEGTWTFSGFTFRNYLEHELPGLVDLKQAMAFSCNTTYMPLSIMVYEEDERALTDLIRDFGFGQVSGVRYLPEARGILPDDHYFERTKRWDGVYRPYNEFDQIQLSIGQGSYLGTPMQVANAYAAIGNGGTLWTPRIVAEIRLSDGGVVEEIQPEVRRRIPMSAENLAYVVDSMQAVVDYPYGTAHGAFAGFGVPVAGKSGTAETGGPDPHAWFPAIAPADAPEISVATVLVRVPLATGGSDAAPLVRRVIAQYWAER